MATLISNTTGNFTGATTWAAVETGASALTLIRSFRSTIGSASVTTTPTFTVTNAVVIDGCMLWLYTSNGTNGTGTIKVDLQKGGVSQASVTVNKSDLPNYARHNVYQVFPPVFFKFTSTATGDGGANWTIVVTTVAGTGNNGVETCRATGTTGDFTRALRTTTAATAAAGDNLFVLGELTGAGTHNAIVVTVDNTSSTVFGTGILDTTSVYGGILGISCWGELTWGSASATNYKLVVAGNVYVWQDGTYTCNTIPRDSTATMLVQQTSASGDFGFTNWSGTRNIVGLSRTSGKNIVQCKLTANVSASANVINSAVTNTNVTVAFNIDSSGYSLQALGLTDTTTNATHSIAWSGPAIANTTQTATVCLMRGVGTNNRYVRMTLGNANVFSSVTNGCYVDIDLQAVTLGTVTAIGTGTATSATITPCGAGFVVRLTGKVASTSATPFVLVNICSAAGTTSFAGANNVAIHYQGLALVTTASLADTTFNVDTDTGWLNGDIICVASTTRSNSTENQSFPLSANAGASSFTSALFPFGAGTNNMGASVATFHGTAPLQAEVGLVTRNIRIGSASSSTSRSTYIFSVSSGATDTFSWCQIFYLGGNGNFGKRGLEFDAAGAGVTFPKVFTYCAMHDYNDSSNGYTSYCNGNNASVNLNWSNNVMWRTYGIAYNNPVSGHDWIYSNNLSIFGGWTMQDCGGTFTNNTIVNASTGFYFNGGGGNAIFGTISGNTAHGCSDRGMHIQAGAVVGTITDTKLYRNTNVGLLINNIWWAELLFVNMTVFGNGNGIYYNTTGDWFRLAGTSVVCGDSTYSQGYGITGASRYGMMDLGGVDFAGGSGIYVPNATADIGWFSGAPMVVTANNCKFSLGAPKTFWFGASSYVAMQRYNQVAGDHRCEMYYGQLRTDTVVYRTAPKSMRMTPNSATYKLESAPREKGLFVSATSGMPVTASVYVRKELTYNGTQPRLIVRQNNALGILTDTVLSTMTSMGTTVAVYVTWDSATKTAVNLSNGDLTITSAGGSSGDQGARVASTYGKTTGKFYYETTMVDMTSGLGTGIGVGTTATGYINMNNSNATGGVSACPHTSGCQIFSNGSNSGFTLSNRADGDIIGVAVDLDNRKAWFRVCPSGNWNGLAIGSQNPVGAVGGATVPAGTMVPYGNFSGNGNIFTTNFGSSAFSGTVPTGFTPGWTAIDPGLTVIGTNTWDLLTGTTISPTDNGVMEFIVDCDGTLSYINVADWLFTPGSAVCDMTMWNDGLPAVNSGGGGGGAFFSGSFS